MPQSGSLLITDTQGNCLYKLVPIVRTRCHTQVYKLGKKGDSSHSAATDFDVTKKDITPMGGFPHYGVVKEDYLMIKVRACCLPASSCVACRRGGSLRSCIAVLPFSCQANFSSFVLSPSPKQMRTIALIAWVLDSPCTPLMQCSADITAWPFISVQPVHAVR